MAEEFEESEVVFEQHYDSSSSDSDVDSDDCLNIRESEMKKKRMEESVSKSMPVNIPVNVNRKAWLRFDVDEEGGEMVPPHVIIGRRVANKVMAFSVCTGNGRTLKGRDLSEVRNSILRMTGFLET